MRLPSCLPRRGWRGLPAIYLHADMTDKERAIARVTPPGTKPGGRYKPSDKLLAFLGAL